MNASVDRLSAAARVPGEPVHPVGVDPGRELGPPTRYHGTGQIRWRLGGKDSSFTDEAAPGQVLDTAGKIFAWQHDPEALGNGIYT
jgi:hypothetical protein